MTLTCALYARISQDDAGREEGVQRQLADGRELAASRGWTVGGEFIDNDLSAYSGRERPGYRALMSAAEAGSFERIVVYHTSRLWRGRVERAGAFERLARLRVGVAAVKGPDLDLTTGSGRMVAGILGEMDTAESAIKGERVERAALERAKEGRANGAAAYGWQREYDQDGRGNVLGFTDLEKPAEANVVREIVDRLLAGDTLRGITDDLNRRGVPAPGTGHRRARRGPGQDDSGSQWGKTSVKKLALRPANIGQRVYKGQVIGEAKWLGIVDPDRHARVVALLTDPARSVRRDGARKHLLSWGIGECGVCGGVLKVTKKGTHHLYVCDPRGCVGRREERVDELVAAVVIERLSRPDAAQMLARDDKAATAAIEKAEAVRARLNSAADAFAAGDITAEQLKRITATLRPALDDAERLATEGRRGGFDAGALGLTGPTAAAIWAALTVSQRRAVLDALGLRVRIMPTRQGPGFDPESVRIEWHA